MQNLSVIHSYTQNGMEAVSVDVEIHLGNGLPAFNVVGMPETVVKESKERVRSAISSSRFEFPAKRITVNLSPADVPKVGGRFDLPIALGILIASGQVKVEDISSYEIIGELALTGEVKPVSGCLPTAVATQKKSKILLLPYSSASEAQLVSDLAIAPVSSLSQAASFLSGQSQLQFPEVLRDERDKEHAQKQTDLSCLSDVKGQTMAKRALEIAASGGHHLLMSGSPGCGKTMLASRFGSLLPELKIDKALETAAIYSVSSIGFDIDQWRQRPSRSPHHSASAVALIGGGSRPLPGEISLAHNGVLFLDELPEFASHTLDQLREPIESGYINIVRAGARVQYPSQFQLLAAMNPCKCGYYGDPSQPERCQCSTAGIEKYRGKVSGPLLDRIDLYINIPRVKLSDLQELPQGESSAEIRKRVIKAQHIQLKRLSARAYTKIIKIARTIADMQSIERVEKTHIMEALGYRHT